MSNPLDNNFHQSNLNPVPRMSEMVGEGVQSRRVTCMDLSCKAVVTIVGLALVIFAIVVFATKVHEFGWATEQLPLYGTMGGVALLGTIITMVSIKWLVEGYEKMKQFQAIAEVV